MNKETLKELIEVEFDRSETISHFKKEVFRLIDMYENDKGKSRIGSTYPVGTIPPPPPPPPNRYLKEGSEPPKPTRVVY